MKEEEKSIYAIFTQNTLYIIQSWAKGVGDSMKKKVSGIGGKSHKIVCSLNRLSLCGHIHNTLSNFSGSPHLFLNEDFVGSRKSAPQRKTLNRAYAKEEIVKGRESSFI